MKQSEDGWATRIGLILAVASGAIGLGNFLRFPGQAVQNGGGAFMVPYMISFVILGIPVCLAEWTMGRMAGKSGHSAPFLFSHFLKGYPLKITGTIGVMVPIMIYVYYVFIESWCLAYAYSFLIGKTSNPNLTDQGIPSLDRSTDFFLTLTGAREHGASFESSILVFFFLCVFFNFILVYRGLSKGLEAFAKLAMPVMAICATIILIRVLTIPGIEKGLAIMWNPKWESLLQPKVWLSAAGQIFFSLSTGFGIALVFSSFLKKKDDVVLSSLSSASLNEFAEVVYGGMITIPVAFLFLGMSATQFGTFGMGFIALPAVFSMMPSGNVFGALWYLVLFLAALTSSVTMLQPGVLFLEEGFRLSKRKASFFIFLFSLSVSLPLIYFNKDFLALDVTDFYVGTVLIYVLATIQIFIFTFKIGVKEGSESAKEGSIIPIPQLIQFVMKYITPWFLVFVFLSFCYMNLPEYWDKMDPSKTSEPSKAYVAQGVVLGLISIFSFFYVLVSKALNNKESHVSSR